jgi:hypothetical protein
MGMASLSAFTMAIAFVIAPVPATPRTDEETPSSAAKLLRYRIVQKELKLTAESRIIILDGIGNIEDGFDKKRKILIGMPNVPEARFDQLDEEERTVTEKFFLQAAAKQLNTAQRLWLKQLDRQVRDTAALADAATAKRLALTDKQLKAVEETIKQLDEKAEAYVDKIHEIGSDNRKDDLIKLRQESAKRLLEMLSADQREQWKQLLGKPIKNLDPLELWLMVLEDSAFRTLGG